MRLLFLLLLFSSLGKIAVVPPAQDCYKDGVVADYRDICDYITRSGYLCTVGGTGDAYIVPCGADRIPGRAIVDATGNEELLRELGISVREEKPLGREISIRLPYALIKRGTVLEVGEEGEITGWGYVFSQGKFLEGEGWKSIVFRNAPGNVILYRDGIAVVSCLPCLDPYLLMQLVDWVEDGNVNFPEVRVERDVPERVEEGESFTDRILIYAPEDSEITVRYSYEVERESSCPLEKVKRVEGYPLELRATYRAEGEYCDTEPTLVEVLWHGKKREIVVLPKRVVVESRGGIQSSTYPWVALLVLLPVVFIVYRRERRKKLVKRREELINMLTEARIKAMKRQISPEVYKEIEKEVTKELLEIESKLGGRKDER